MLIIPLAVAWIVFVLVPGGVVTVAAARRVSRSSGAANESSEHDWLRGAAIGAAVHALLVVVPAFALGDRFHVTSAFGALCGWPHLIHYGVVFALWPPESSADSSRRFRLAGGYAASWLVHPVLAYAIIRYLDATRLPHLISAFEHRGGSFAIGLMDHVTVVFDGRWRG